MHSMYVACKEWHDMVYGCMVYAELVPRWHQFHMAPAMQQPNSTVSIPLWCIFKKHAIKKSGSIIYNHMQQECSESAGEQRIMLHINIYIKAINNSFMNLMKAVAKSIIWWQMLKLSPYTGVSSLSYLNQNCRMRCSVSVCQPLFTTSMWQANSRWLVFTGHS